MCFPFCNLSTYVLARNTILVRVGTFQRRGDRSSSQHCMSVQCQLGFEFERFPILSTVWPEVSVPLHAERANAPCHSGGGFVLSNKWIFEKKKKINRTSAHTLRIQLFLALLLCTNTERWTKVVSNNTQSAFTKTFYRIAKKNKAHCQGHAPT